MIRLALFDVGDTLIHAGQPYPGVTTALDAISRFESADGKPLTLGIVSDYYLPSPQADVLTLEARYRREVLEPAGLQRFFEPFDRRVTLSSRAGVSKPDRALFELAVARSGTGAVLTECLFVTENRTHLEKGQGYGITPVLFGSGPAPSFSDWIDAPTVLAALVAPGNAANATRAIASQLAGRHQLVNFRPTKCTDRRVQGEAAQLMPLHDPSLGPLNGVYVELPVEVSAEVGPDGRLTAVQASTPDAETVADAVSFVAGLVRTGSVAIPGQPARPSGVTHVVEDHAGRRCLKRRGYAAR